uniref:CA174 protein n=1 Tax=Salvator merianae TaxID=96440 RepID=A0A8D0BTU5_SALMN
MRARRGSSCKATNRNPSKKLKCKKKSLAKLGVQEAELGRGTSHLLPSEEPAEKGAVNANLPDLKMMLQSKGKTISEMTEEMGISQRGLCAEPLSLASSDRCPKGADVTLFQRSSRNAEAEGEDSASKEENCGVPLSDDSEMEPEHEPHQELKLDDSVFLNEDSSQPLPVDRFFGSVAFMQDLPAVPAAPQSSSRREFRKLHFIAKEEEEEEEEDAL